MGSLAEAIALLRAARSERTPSQRQRDQEESLSNKRRKIGYQHNHSEDSRASGWQNNQATTKAVPNDVKAQDASTRKWQHDEPPPAKLAGKCWELHRSKVQLKLIGENSPADPWTYFLQDESRRSFAGHLANALDEAACASFFAEVRNGTTWLQPGTRWGPMPRKTAWMVASPCTCAYYYGGMEVQPHPYPPWMIELMQVVMPRCGLLSPSDMPDSCNLNLYEDGSKLVGWHADDEDLFQGKFRDCRIISLSLGVPRKFELELNWPGREEQLGVHQILGDGDLCTMEGMTQKHYMHRVPEEENAVGPRINLTWRWIAKHEPSCKNKLLRK